MRGRDVERPRWYGTSTSMMARMILTLFGQRDRLLAHPQPCSGLTHLFCILSHLVLTVAFTLFGQLHVTALYFLVFVWIYLFQSCHDGHDEAYDESTRYGREEASSLHGPQ